MNFNKIVLVTGLVVSGVTVSSIFAPAQALTWHFDYISPTGSGTVNTILTTNGSSYATNTIYNVTGISGTVNGNQITGLITSTPGNLPGYPGLVFDNSFVWNGSTGILLTYNGLGFLDASTLAHNIWSNDGSSLSNNAISDFTSTNLLGFAVTTGNPPYISTPPGQNAPVTFSSLTPIPESSSPYGLLMFGFLGAGYMWKSKLNKK